MKNLALGIASLLALTACSEQAPPPAGLASHSFFIGVDTAALSEPARSAIISAQKDIDLVVQGRAPACKDEPDSAESDGGTAHYECDEYRLTVMQSMYRVGDISGYIYGPIVTFPGDYPVSFVRFYSNEEFMRLRRSGMDAN